MAVVFSTTKGPTTLTIQALAEQGTVDLERPVADYWPEFAAAGKGGITLRHILTHTSGVIDFPGYEAVVEDTSWWHDLDAVAAAFAAASPAWEPGTAHGYHGVSFGLLLGEVVRRATGATLGDRLRPAWWPGPWGSTSTSACPAGRNRPRGPAGRRPAGHPPRASPPTWPSSIPAP